MLDNKNLTKQNNRWFIWAIVLLLVSGFSLVSYIMITDINQDAEIDAVVVNPQRR